MAQGATDAPRHTLLLLQFNSSISSRTFLDYESIDAAMDGVCHLYEKEVLACARVDLRAPSAHVPRLGSCPQLKVLNPKMANITYDISDLFSYLDQVTDISLLIYQEPIHGYLPRNREWVKRQLYTHLRGQAAS